MPIKNKKSIIEKKEAFTADGTVPRETIHPRTRLENWQFLQIAAENGKKI